MTTFPDHEFEPLNWNDMLATVDVCANIYATRHCDKDPYDIISINMVKVIQAHEEMGIDSNHCNEELFLEGLEMDSSKTMSIIQEDTVPNVPLMPVNMEIMSIEDLKVQEESQTNSKGDSE